MSFQDSMLATMAKTLGIDGEAIQAQIAQFGAYITEVNAKLGEIAAKQDEILKRIDALEIVEEEKE